MAQNQNRNMNQQNKGKIADITDTLIDVDPITLGFNLRNDHVTEFVRQYFESRSDEVPGFLTARCVAEDNGRRLGVYVFFELNSPSIMNTVSNLPHYVRDKIELSGIKASEALKRALGPFVSEIQIDGDRRKNIAIIQLNEIKTIGLMLKADPSFFRIDVTDIKIHKKDRVVFTVFKSVRMVDNKHQHSNDPYTQMIARMR